MGLSFSLFSIVYVSYIYKKTFREGDSKIQHFSDTIYNHMPLFLVSQIADIVIFIPDWSYILPYSFGMSFVLYLAKRYFNTI